jgi:hypothetical protein
MSQIYTENVLVNNSDPPSLTNLILLFLMIDIILNFIIILILFLLLKINVIDQKVLKTFVLEYILILIVMTIPLYFIASIMYSKKYFLYKDDGLRGIRALKQICLLFIFIYYSLPFGYFIQKMSFSSNIPAISK